MRDTGCKLLDIRLEIEIAALSLEVGGILKDPKGNKVIVILIISLNSLKLKVLYNIITTEG